MRHRSGLVRGAALDEDFGLRVIGGRVTVSSSSPSVCFSRELGYWGLWTSSAVLSRSANNAQPFKLRPARFSEDAVDNHLTDCPEVDGVFFLRLTRGSHNSMLRNAGRGGLDRLT